MSFMFYEPVQGHGLPWDPIKALVAPRPIGWISTVDEEGRSNLAPYSFFNLVQARPPIVAFGSEGMKDTPALALAAGEFVVNICTRDLAHIMNQSSKQLPRGQSEFDLAGIEALPSRLVRPPRVAQSPAALECRVTQSLGLHDIQGKPTGGFLVLGEVVGVHINADFLLDGRFDIAAAQTLARCGYRSYLSAGPDNIFEIIRPDDAPGGESLR